MKFSASLSQLVLTADSVDLFVLLPDGLEGYAALAMSHDPDAGVITFDLDPDECGVSEYTLEDRTVEVDEQGRVYFTGSWDGRLTNMGMQFMVDNDTRPVSPLDLFDPYVSFARPC